MHGWVMQQLKLVRVQSETGAPSAPSVRVLVPDPDKPRQIHIEFHSLQDRRDLLVDVLEVIHTMPIQVRNACSPAAPA